MIQIQKKTSRRWCFTENNYEEVPNFDCKYSIIGKEVGEGGTPHLQGYVVFNTMKRLSALKKLLPKAHWEIAGGTTEENYIYCSKEGDYIETGEKPKDRVAQAKDQKERYQAIIASAKAGTLEEDNPKEYWRNYNTAKRVYADNMKAEGIEKRIKVYWGSTGTGKSHKAWEEATIDAYPKDPNSKWWTGYSGQENVVIEEFRGKVDISHILRWLDKYPVIVEIKGSATPLKCKNIWITSNLHPTQWYPDIDPETRDALLRRLDIYHFQHTWNSYFGTADTQSKIDYNNKNL